jgi:hypothetical protein
MADKGEDSEFLFACTVGDLRVMRERRREPLKNNREHKEAVSCKEFEGARSTECRCLRVELNGRSIVIFMVGDDKLFAMDQKCYRKYRYSVLLITRITSS